LVTLNGDFGHDTHTEQLDVGPNATTADWFGLSLAGRYRFGEMWGIGLRGEYLADPDHFLCNAARAPVGMAGLCYAAGIVPISVAEDMVQSGTLNVIGQGFALLSGTLTLEALPVDHLVIR